MKIIDNCINNYFANYYKKIISNFMLRWFLDTNFETKKTHIFLKIKKPHYKDEFYEVIYGWDIENSLYKIIDFKENGSKFIETKISEYLKENK